MADSEWIESYVPARLDRMPWSRWHWLIVVSLGATWILDGLEVTLAGSLGGILTRRETLGLTDTVVGALLFGYGTDRFGRKKLFFITVAVYLIGTALSAFSWNFASYAFFRALTGAGIGGEYAAINSAIDELIPARPRWLMIHGRSAEAEKIVDEVERRIVSDPETLPAHDSPPTRIYTRTHTPWREIWNAIAHEHRHRSFLAFVLMLTQAFFYNAIFFTYALVLMRFYGVPANNVGGYLLPFALGNILGPVVLGHFFDTIGRKQMIAATYGLSGILLAITGWLFHAGLLTAQTQTVAWTIIFFVASAAASSAYLTVSEIFPLEIRALAIAIFYAVGTLTGGVFAPLLFGWIIGTGSSGALFVGYLFGAALMICAALVEAWIGVKAERRSLESIAAPLSSKH